MATYYTIRDFYKENGKSLKMPYQNYWDDVVRWKHRGNQRNAFWSLFKKLHRVNGWHKKEIIKQRLNKRYNFTAISMACDSLYRIRRY